MSSRMKGSLAAIALLAIALWWLALGSRTPVSEPAAYVLVEEPPAPSAVPPPKAAAPAAVEPQPTRIEPPSAQVPADPPAQPLAATPDPAPSKPKGPIPPDTRGFLDALRGRFDGEPRDSAASEVEGRIRRMFRAEGMPSGLLRNVLCRELVCKLELHWTPEHDEPYRNAMHTLIGGNAKTMATDASPPDANGAVEVKAYWRRMVDNLPP